MREQHDTKLLESMMRTASERLEAPAREIKAASDRRTQEVSAQAHKDVVAADASASTALIRAQGLRTAMVLLAIATLVVAIGIAARLALGPEAKRLTDFVTLPSPAQTTAASPEAIWLSIPQPSGNSDAEEAIITTNFSLFRSKNIRIDQRSYVIKAGHHFAKGTDTQFEHAWCYTQIEAGGILVSVELGTKLPSSAPAAGVPTSAEMNTTGLGSDGHRKLFNACPWIDGNPDLTNVPTPTVSNSYLFTGDVTPESVNQLIAAVKRGANMIEFNSPGGSLIDAIRGYQALKTANVQTLVTAECASACSVLFLAGQQRAVQPAAKLGVHQWRSIKQPADEAEAQSLSGALVALFKDAGVSEEFFIAGSQASSSSMHWLTMHELRNWGVVTI